LAAPHGERRTLTLSNDWVDNFVTHDLRHHRGDRRRQLDLSGGVTIDNGTLGHPAATSMYRQPTRLRTRPAAAAGSAPTSSPIPGRLTVGGTDVGAHTRRAPGTLTAQQRLGRQLRTTTYGIIAVTADGSLDLSGGVTIDNGTLGNAGGYINCHRAGHD